MTHFYSVTQEHRDKLAKTLFKLRGGVDIDHFERPHRRDVRKQIALHLVAQVAITAGQERIGHLPPRDNLRLHRPDRNIASRVAAPHKQER